MKSFSSCHVAPPEPSSAKKKQPSPMASNSNSTIPTTIYSKTSRSIQTIPNRRPGAPKANGQPVKLEGHAPANPAPANPAPENPAPVTPAPVTPAPAIPAPLTPAMVPPAMAIPAQAIPAPARVAPIEQILRTPRTPESRAKMGHAKVLRIAVVLADLAPTRTEPRQAGRDQVPLNVVGPEWAALNPEALNPAAQNAEAQNLVAQNAEDQNAVVQNPAVQNAEAQNLVVQNAAALNPAGQNAAVAVVVRKASKVFSLFVSPPSVSFPRASRLACRCKIDTLRTVGNPWHAGAIPKAPLQGLPI